MVYTRLNKDFLICALLTFAAVLGFTACSKDEAAPQADAAAVEVAPTNATAEQETLPPGQSTAGETAPAENGYALISGNIKFNKFNIEILADPQPEMENYQRVTILHNGVTVSGGDDSYRSVEISDRIMNYPQEGCETLSLEMFTGGANCCFGYYLLTSCPDSDSASFVAPIPGGLGAEPKNLGQTSGFPITDPSFMYYEPAGQQGEDPMFLSGAESPRLTRFVVFDVDRWRLDKRAEFSGVYRQLSAEADGLQADGPVANPVARAIYMCYYSYMAGDDPASVKALLKTQLPEQYSNLSDVIFNDIEKAVAEYNPLETLELHAEQK